MKVAYLVLVLTCCVGSVHTQTNSGAWKKYVSPKKTYSLSLPSDWKVGPQGSVIEVSAEMPSGAASLWIDAAELDPTNTLDAYYKSALGGYRRWSHGFRILEEKHFTAGPLYGKELIYTVEPKDHQRVQLGAFYLVDRGRVATIHVSARTPEEFMHIQHLFEEIAASFRFAE